MGYYTRKLAEARKLYNERYAKETAFGDTELIKLSQTIAEVTRELVGHEECSECDGYGEVDCHCCNNTSVCKECNGKGLIKK